MASSSSTEERDHSVLTAFLSIPDSPNCFRFYSRSGSNAGVYVLGWWATCIATEFIKSEAVVKNWSETPSSRNSGGGSIIGSSSPMTTIPVIVLNDTICKEVIADCLLRRGTSVEFYDKNSRGEFECVQRGSPGNITDFEATLFEQEQESDVQLMASGALVFGGAPTDGTIRIGLATLNTTLRHISVAEYRDVVQLVDLDVLLAQLSVKELSLTLSSAVGKEKRSSTGMKEEGEEETGREAVMKEPIQAVRRLCERLRIHLTIQNGFSEVQAPLLPADVALKDLLRVPEERMHLLDFPLGSKACAFLLTKVDLLDPHNHRAFYLRHVMPSTFMKLDSAALEALHMFSDRPDAKGMAPTSVYSWLSRGVTTGMGGRVMRQWLLQPLRHTADIIQRQSMVQLLLDNTTLRDALVSEVLRKCGGDMDRLNRKLMRRRVSLKDLKKVLQFIDVLPVCVRVLRLASNGEGQRFSKLVMDEYTAPLEEIVEHTSNLRVLVESSVDFTSDPVAPRINPAFDDALQDVHHRLLVIQHAMEKEYQLLGRRYRWAEKGKVKLEYHNSYGYVFRLPGKENREVRSEKELIFLSTAKDGVRFVSESLAALSSQYKSVSDEYDRRQETLKQKLIDTVSSYLPLLDDAKEILAALDVFVAWATLVKDSPNTMVCPTVYDPPSSPTRSSLSSSSLPTTVKLEGAGDAALTSSPPSYAEGRSRESAGVRTSSSTEGTLPLLHFHQLRHPLVELRQASFHPNSVQLSTAHNGMVITGPNMGGKSTFMRSVGVAVVLAQVGCFVPAEAAELTVRDAVMCRVGATDHLSQGVSTFMVEMLESSAILSQATPQTLAIVDELGRGTSTYDGFGLAWAIAKAIGCDIGATLLFSTHFHEMTELPSKYSQLQNFHFGAAVNEEAGTLQFLYQLEPGPCGQSYGLYVAALARMPEEVIENAKRKALALETFEKNDVTQQGKQAVVEVIAGNEELGERVKEYAARVRHATQVGDESALNNLRDEIAQDPLVWPLLSST